MIAILRDMGHTHTNSKFSKKYFLERSDFDPLK